MSTRIDDSHYELLAVPDLARAFGLDRAQLVLAVGSRAQGLADSCEDTDFLAVYPSTADLPTVDYPGLVGMPSAVGANWSAQVGDNEIHVQMATVATLDRLAPLLTGPLSQRYVPSLDSLEVQLLDRLRTGSLVQAGTAAGDNACLADLRARLELHRLPLVVMVMNYYATLSYLELAAARVSDPLGFRVALNVVTEALAITALCLNGTVLYNMKKAGTALIALECQHQTLPVSVADIRYLLLTADQPDQQLLAARAALRRVRELIRSRSVAGDQGYAEALRTITPLETTQEPE